MLYFVPTPIGNLEDVSLRSLKLFEEAEVIFCEDTRVTKRLLDLLSKRHSITPKAKEFISLHSHNEKTVISKLQKSLFEKVVLYVSDAGMPAVSDPGCELVRFAQKEGISYEVLPGANAALLAYASSGFCDTRFLFFGFLPHKGKEREKALHEALFSGYVTLLYEAPHRIEKLLVQIVQIDPERTLFLIKEATKLHQKSFKGSAKELQIRLKSENLKGEWVVVIEGGKKEMGAIGSEDILALDIPKKQAAKLLAKITGKSPKECYNGLL